MTVQIPEIRAEMLLGYLYPELEDQWIAHHEGTFYRNYSRDMLDLRPDELTVWLSRDSFLHLLPQGLFSREDELKKGDWQEKYKEQEKRRKVLSEAFLPFDSFGFRRQLQMERNVSALVRDKLEYVLKTYFDYDLTAEENPFVREFAALLPFVRQWRGDFGLIRNLLSAVFHCEVTLQERRYSQTDSTRQWLPVIRYELLVPDLPAQDYLAMNQRIQPLEAFLSEWFMPMEVRLELLLKQHRILPQVSSELILDYNTELPEQIG
jgi:hypothetical protein